MTPARSPLLALTLLVSAAPAVGLCAECPVAGPQLFEYTQSQGITSAGRPAGAKPATSCTEDWPAVTVSAPAEAPGTCRLDLFRGAKLAAGWKVKGYRFIGLAPTIVQTASGSRMSMSVTATARAGESANISLARLVLAGPNCDQWRDAIVAGPAE